MIAVSLVRDTVGPKGAGKTETSPCSKETSRLGMWDIAQRAELRGSSVVEEAGGTALGNSKFSFRGSGKGEDNSKRLRFEVLTERRACAKSGTMV